MCRAPRRLDRYVLPGGALVPRGERGAPGPPEPSGIALPANPVRSAVTAAIRTNARARVVRPTSRPSRPEYALAGAARRDLFTTAPGGVELGPTWRLSLASVILGAQRGHEGVVDHADIVFVRLLCNRRFGGAHNQVCMAEQNLALRLTGSRLHYLL